VETIITNKIKKHLPEIKRGFKVKEIGIFGSRIKGKAKRKSDIDILVEFEKGYKTFDNYMELKFYLEDLFGCKVDLVLKSSLKEEIRNQILSEVVYA
jgi:predicted nucleotidyltransferase